MKFYNYKKIKLNRILKFKIYTYKILKILFSNKNCMIIKIN